MTDKYELYSGGLDSPAFDAVAITPADSDLATFIRALYVGSTGDVAVKTVGGTTLTFTAVQAGSILPVRCKQVLSTGTTATNIVGLI